MKYSLAAGLSALFFVSAPVSAQVLYNNGVVKGGSGAFGITTNPGAGFGGSDASQAQPGYGRSLYAPIFADNFTLGSFQSVISSLTVYSHLLNYQSTVSPITSTTIDIYTGRPGDAGSSIIASSSNQGPSDFSGVYRVSSGSTALTLTDATRPVFATTVSFTNLTLDAGNYWFSFRQTASVAGNIDVSSVMSASDGVIQMVAGNALGFNATTNVWDPLNTLPIPGGTNPNAPGVQIETPFLVNGREIAAPQAPEPGTLLLAFLPAMGTLAFRFRRRRCA